MSRGINNCAVVLGGLKLPQRDINGDTSFTLSLKFVKHPGVFERPLVHLSSFLLESFDHTLVNTTELVDQMTGCGRLAGVDMSDDDNTDMNLFFTHPEINFIQIVSKL
ncbi:hypothetical protein Hanom_Chr14g01313621 [Helianthus anomalus]